MRLQLNLNQYYDGMDIAQVNKVFSQFLDLKIRIDQLKLLLNYPAEKQNDSWKQSRDFYKKKILNMINEINDYMESLGKEKIFNIGESIENTNFESIISKYEYLMSAPKKEERNSNEGQEQGDR